MRSSRPLSFFIASLCRNADVNDSLDALFVRHRRSTTYYQQGGNSGWLLTGQGPRNNRAVTDNANASRPLVASSTFAYAYGHVSGATERGLLEEKRMEPLEIFAYTQRNLGLDRFGRELSTQDTGILCEPLIEDQTL